jgi:transposase-like protein
LKLSEDKVKEILRLKEQGLSSRQIAGILDVSKTAVNDWVARSSIFQEESKKQPRLLVFDVEIFPSIAATFGRFNQTIGHNNVIREGGAIVSAAWKYYGDIGVTSVVMTPEEAIKDDDTRVVCELYEAFERADAVIVHNANFDLPVFKARLALHRMPMHKTVKIIDTYKISKGMRFNSRKLDSLADYFNAGRKVTHEGINLWIRCMNGDDEALDLMKRYNEQDIVLLEEVYNCIKAYDNKPVNLGQYFEDNEHHCPACGSTDIASTGNLVYTEVSAFDEVKCNSCGHRSRKRVQRNSKEKRSNLLMG